LAQQWPMPTSALALRGDTGIRGMVLATAAHLRGICLL
jgi:hypothetical protein